MTKLFAPVKLGKDELAHRVVMAPLTRYRCDDDWVPLPIAKEYYSQRACIPGTLIISEATVISLRHAGRRNVPGLWAPAQIAAWREITNVVHAQGCRIWCQLWAQGRAGHADVLEGVGSKLMSSSAIPLSGDGKPVPVEMTEDDIQGTINDYVTAARNAIEAGFDGVEVHGGNGYLPDQFLQDTCNKRTDGWGGTIEKRCRFHLALMEALVAAVGAERTAVRLSPWSDFLDMLMDDPLPTFTHLVSELKKMKLGYLSLIEARISGNDDTNVAKDKDVSFLVKLWDNISPVILAGGFNTESAKDTVDVKYADYDVAIAFGRYFVSNPDLVYRVQETIAMTKYDRAVFYTPKLAKGYVDWDFSPEFVAARTSRIVA
ncbi:hypothetical protein BAUCODRAFT_141299 [Baudoinia panamericana UAMH 10762]|uniref:NADH:flavin oxidoreductase/NADH oxidase N-terminal domain-containing protein n=1 Tax=Baudoinia panamericana (strain UAMH 10762) TaxID=717646 RepID=M2MBJ1_BAUPA|nr:uncharacterized protein BAUCODRAFT_141299 [Baudoinia panamericana UAMH 10762]EMC93881.1 hypothetical protein BAUCODRAFT_141299 [Baudoinia panamericana UAMH 10762]